MRHSTRRTAQSGQSTLESALVLVPFLLLVMGAFDLGRSVLYQHLLNNAVREGARLGVSSARTPEALCARVRSVAQLPGTAAPQNGACGATETLAVLVEQRGTAGSASAPVRISASYVFRPVTPLIGAVVGNGVTLTASSSMYVES